MRKMSEVFTRKLNEGDISLCIGSHVNPQVALSYADKAAAHAINCHDELVNQLQESNDCMLALAATLKDCGHSVNDLMQQIKLNEEVSNKARGV